MPCCCNKIYDLCKVSVCGGIIETGLTAEDPGGEGVYILVTEFLGIAFNITAEIEAGDPINFPTTGLNENYTYNGYILKPDGEKLTLTYDAVEYDCLSFKTQLKYSL